MIPPLLDEHVNSQLINVPQKISVTQMISYISHLVGRPKKLPEYVSAVVFSLLIIIAQLSETLILIFSRQTQKHFRQSVSF